MQMTTFNAHLSKLPSGSIMAVLCVTGALALPSSVNSFRVVQDSLAPAAFLTCDYRPRVKGAMNTEKRMNKTPSFKEWLAGKPIHFKLKNTLTTLMYTPDNKCAAFIQNLKIVERHNFSKHETNPLHRQELIKLYANAKALGECL